MESERATVTTLRSELNISQSQLRASVSERHASGSDADRLLQLEIELANLRTTNAGLCETSNHLQEKFDKSMETMRTAQKETLRLSVVNEDLHQRLTRMEKESTKQKEKLNAWRT